MVTRKVDWYTDQCNLSCRVELSFFAVSLKYILLVRSLRRGNAINAEHFNTRGFYSTEKKNSLQIHAIQQCYNTLYTYYALFFLRSTNYILLILCRRLSLLCVVLAMLVLLSHSISHTYTYVDVVI